MKSFRLMLRFYKENWLSLLLLLAVTLYSTSMLMNVVSQFSYANYVKDVFSDPAVQDSVYYMPGSFENTPKGLARIKIDLESRKLPGVKGIIQPVGGVSVGCGELFSNVAFCDATYRDAFSLVDEGRWLSQADAETPEIEAVVSGYLFYDRKPGDEIEVTVNPYGDPPITKRVNVIGAKREPAFLPAFNLTATSVTVPGIFEQGHNMILICKEDAAALLQGMGNGDPSFLGIPSENLLIRFRENVTEAEREAALSELSETGSFVTHEQIMVNTEEDLAQMRKEQLPRPLLMLFVSTFSMIAIGVLIIDKKLSEYRIYFLCGCSRRKGIFQMLGAISLVPVFAALIDLLYIAVIPSLYGITSLLSPLQGVEKAVYDSDVILALLAYFAVTLLLSVIVPFFNICKETAIQTYRRKT